MKMKNEYGQSTIEFILTFALTLGVVVLLLSATMNYVTGYLVHYATFSASRAYLTYDEAQPDISSAIRSAEDKAKTIFDKFLVKSFGVSGILSFNNPGLDNIYEYVGVFYNYKTNLKGTGFIGGKEIKMLSESFLGKEPTRSDCRCQTQQAIGISCNGSFSTSITEDVTLYDNGC